jgi:Flp pilus assembly protein CpaB
VKRSNRLVILVGVLLAVLAFVAIVILLNQDGDGGNGGPEEPVLETVLVATEDIDIGEEITPAKVETLEIQPEAVQGDPLSDPSQVSGQPALFPIPEGSQVTAQAIGIGDQTVINIAALLNPGEKAIAFQVDRVTGLDFLVKPGDTIDLIVSQDVPAVQETADSAANTDPEAEPRFETFQGLENQRSVKAILQNKRVLYVSETRAVEAEPTEDTNGDGVIDENDTPAEQAIVDNVIIVFAGTDQDAEIVKFAEAQAQSISAVIRHADDDAAETTIGITLRQLVDAYGLLIPDIIQLQVEAAE